jgi:hypothetical protein
LPNFLKQDPGAPAPAARTTANAINAPLPINASAMPPRESGSRDGGHGLLPPESIPNTRQPQTQPAEHNFFSDLFGG